MSSSVKIGNVRFKDGLQNVMSGLGTSKSKAMNNFWVYDWLNAYQQLDACYQTNWIARQIVDVPAQDMTREWRTIKNDYAEDIANEELRLGLRHKVSRALSWSRLFGGSVVLMLTNQDLEKPLNVDKIGKGDLKRLLVFDRWDLSYPYMNVTNVLAENYLQPEYYTIYQGAQKIHWSHFARFNGEKLPLRQMQYTHGWGDSVLRKCLQDVTDTVASKNGIAELLQEANIDIITANGLQEHLSSDQDANIIKRYELFSQMKSIINMALLDENEKFDRKTLTLSGVAPVLELFITWISGAARIPVTKLFGTSAKGLNATGEGDLKTYYDDIRSMQFYDLEQPMRTLDEVIVRSAIGSWPDNYDYQWNPLSQPTAVELAQAQLITAQKNAIYLESGVIQRSQIQRNLQASDEYQFDEEDIDELEELESANMFEGLPPVEGSEESEESETQEENEAE